MSVSLGKPSIVTNGLILHLDPASQSNFKPLDEVEVLVVAGGGGAAADVGGAGGAGGLLYNSSYPITSTSPINVTVGNGGQGNVPFNGGPGANGQNSVFGTLTAIGGGGGGNYNAGSGSSGGSGGGGGGGSTGRPAGSGTPGQGNDGGTGFSGAYASGGGGGAGGKGKDSTTIVGGRGGDGLSFSISGTPRYYAGGGGGGGGNDSGSDGRGFGGLGGGGTGASRSGTYNSNASFRDGAPNTGGGGGGTGGWNTGGNGGSGVVIVRYPGPQKATGGTITNVGGHTIHTFTGSDTFTPLTEVQLKSSPYGLIDLSGNKNNAILTAPFSYNTAEKFLKFSSNGVATVPSLLLSSVTWEVVYRSNSSDTFSTYGRILDYNDTTISIGTVSSYQLRMWTNAGGSRSTESQLNGVGRDNTWHHLIYSYDGSTTAFYFDSVYQNGYAKSGALNGGSSADLTIGNGDGNPFNGDIAIVRVYNRALSVSEIQQNFNALRGRFGI